MFERPPFVDHLSAFAGRHPDIRLGICFSDRRADLNGSKLDLAIRAGRLEDSRYKAGKLTEINHVVIASPTYMAGKRRPETIADLAAFDWIRLTQIPINRQLTNRRGEVPNLNPSIALEVDSAVALAQMVKNGMGLAAIPEHVVQEELRSGGVIALPVAWQLKPISVYAVWPGNLPPESLSGRFVQFLVDRFRQNPDGATGG